MKSLFDNCIYASGTVRRQRADLPKIVKSKKKLKLKKGKHKWRVKGDVAFVIWQDTKEVLFLTNAFHPNVNITSVTRTQKDGTKTDVGCPAVVKQYTKRMGGVDHFDHIKGTYSVGRRSRSVACALGWDKHARVWLGVIMDGNNENIVRWLEEELSDVEDTLDESCSDVEPEDLEVPVILEDCESDDCLQVSSSDEQSADGQPEGGLYTQRFSVSRISDGSGREIYRCILSKNRFEILMKAIRFDDAETRAQRRETDISAPIAELFSSFIQNCQKVYSIGTCACIDEMLVAFRGRCRFRMFMPKKPAKYGLKIMCLTDARNGYLLNAYLYLGKDSDGINLTPEQTRFSKPTQAVLRLISPIEGSNRNVTADNWFCSVELVDVLKDKKLSLVGTLKKNKKEIPPEFKPYRRREIGTSLFGFTKNITLTSFVPKKNSAVVLISSMNHTANVDDNTKKPEIILYYNNTKIGVDLLDQRCSNYTTARRTQRWPLCIFYRLLDILASNTYVMSLQNQAQKTGSRFKFIKQLAEELTRPHMKRRENNEHTPRDIKTSIRQILKIADELPTVSGADYLETRKTCSTCNPKKKRKTFHLCFICKKPICVKCSNKMCKNCREKL
ncbi:PiggyBac transposable element-derived protein 4 [Eumeta japonica]|uniref:PiggyBac transposable element-derived protein 4 n=1 Tax=Eumeta variegata TaxID=151549 RepID=A0A4C1UAY6_EUMVA|nr:PiggyBac transposable element-derived protein 4 [Eumeta japonica]